VLVLAVIALAGAWLTSSRQPEAGSLPATQSVMPAGTPAADDAAATTPARQDPPAAERVARQSTVPEPVPAQPAAAPTPAPTSAGSNAAPTSASTRAGSNAAPLARAPQVAAAPAPRYESLPTVTEAMAAGVALPALTLELHVYHDTPASRWVYINGTRYTEGRRLAEGPELVGIVPEGVVLRQGGREFLLLAQ
jgi:hypothetical protein